MPLVAAAFSKGCCGLDTGALSHPSRPGLSYSRLHLAHTYGALGSARDRHPGLNQPSGTRHGCKSPRYTGQLEKVKEVKEGMMIRPE